MSTESAKEWLDQAKSEIKRIQTTFAAVGVFIVVLSYTLSLQFFQLREYQKDHREVSTILSHRWDKLESVYHQAPFKKYYDEELRPWYLLCLATRERNKVLRDQVKLFKTDQSETTIRRIDSALMFLGEYNSSLQSIINARQFNTPFNDLDSSKLKTLMVLLSFRPPDGEENLKAGLTNARESAEVLLAFDSQTVDELTKPPFKMPLDVARELKREELKLPEHIAEILKAGIKLNVLTTFELEMEVEDVNTFGRDRLTDQEKGELLADLDRGRISSLRQLYARKAELKHEIDSRQANSFTTGPEISIPLLGIPIPLNLFGLLGGVLNVALLVYLLWLLARLKDSFAKASAASDGRDVELFSAIASALPLARLKHKPRLVLSLVVLVMPSLLTALLLIAKVRFRFFPMVIVISSIILTTCLAYEYQRKARAIAQTQVP